ncbi:MAG TPA: PAS domain-containing sensor histidine kinase [Desulfobacteraceae bacterium]|nr:PAS domain-containing sensor histidine kinase [Desulfobacteraceae bacterium]
MMDKETKRVASIFESMEDGIYITDDDYNLEFMNKAMIREFGKGIGKKCYQAINRLHEICPWCRAKEVFSGETIHWQYHPQDKEKTYDIIELPLKNADGTLSKLSILRDITQRKKREDIIKSSMEDYKSLFEHVGCGVYISSKEGKFLNANKALLDMLGYKNKEEFLKIDIGKDLYLRPEDRRKFQEMMERDGKVIDLEVYFKRKDGTPISVLHTSHARYNPQGDIVGYEGLNVDQSQRKKMERKLIEAHDFMDNIIQSSPNAIMAADMKGNIIIWNKASEETLGYDREDVIGRMNITSIYPEGVAKEIMKMMRSPEYGGVGKLRSHPIVYVRQDRGIVEGDLSAVIIYDANGKEVASVGIFVDLKDRLEMERKLRQTQEQLLQSEKLAAMGRLTSQIAHELNNPLYGIMNTLELMKTEISPESKRRKILEMALSETVRLTEMLRKMLSFSKPDEEERQPTDINTILDEMLLLHEKQLSEHGISISSSFTDDLRMVHASKNQLRQVFLNMISNARDAMPEGGVLAVTSRAEGDNVHIDISDTGTGIREENLDRVFDAFFTTKDNVKDVGLGLSVCYGFIKDHGGDIKVESQRGSGTTFTIVLPALTAGSENKATDKYIPSSIKSRNS